MTLSYHAFLNFTLKYLKCINGMHDFKSFKSLMHCKQSTTLVQVSYRSSMHWILCKFMSINGSPSLFLKQVQYTGDEEWEDNPSHKRYGSFCIQNAALSFWKMANSSFGMRSKDQFWEKLRPGKPGSPITV